MKRLALALIAFVALLLPALAQDFPVTIEHKFGSTTIPAKPARVVSLGFSGHDDILALGVVPVAIRWWYGDYPDGVWPWAQDALQGQHPVQLKGDLNIEQIAALQPDLIIALSSGITAEQYGLLSQIAPTVANPPGSADYGVPWDISAQITGLALGEVEKADALVADIRARIEGIAAAHPDWAGKTAAVAFYWNDAPGAYRSIDPRAHLLEDFGFKTPDAINAAGAADAFFVSLSAEDLTPLDTDILIWFDEFENVDKLKLRTTLKAHTEGREIFSDDLLSGAFSHSSLLSLPYALDNLVPLIELAVDGDPATVVPGSEGP